MMQEMLGHLQNIYVTELKEPKLYNQLNVLLEGVRSRQYQPLLSRVKCGNIFTFDVSLRNIVFFFYFSHFVESLENRIAHYAKKRRIEVQNKSDSDGMSS